MSPTSPQPRDGKDRPQTVVIGGGIAGLAAAVAISDRGQRVLVCEARQRLGGRAASFHDPTTGDEVDNGQHALMGCYHRTLEFLRHIGALPKVVWQRHLHVPYVDLATGQRATLSSGRGPSPLHVASAIVRFALLPRRLRFEALVGGIRIYLLRRRNHLLLRHVTVEDLLQLCGQHELTRQRLWHPIALATLNEWPRRAAAAPFAEVIARAFFGSTRDSRFVFPRVPLSALYVDDARAFIERRGGAVRTGAVVQRLLCGGGQVHAVELRDGTILPVGAVVCTAPPHHSRQLLQEHGIDIPEATYAPIVSLHLWFDQPPQLPPFVGLLHGRAQWVFDRHHLWQTLEPGLSGKAHLASVVISAAYEEITLSDSELRETVVQELFRAFPHLRGIRLRHDLVVREKRATPSLTPTFERQRPPVATRLRNLFLAGDWVRTGLPATIESAVASAFTAADAVVRAQERA